LGFHVLVSVVSKILAADRAEAGLAAVVKASLYRGERNR
jgi:hypothetical protein